ncbi:MAG: thioredoxin family protein [Desulfococcaceae bacterium]
MKKNVWITVLCIAAALAVAGIWKNPFSPQTAETPSSHSGSVPSVPVKGMVTMVDLGAKKCIPCKMMAPILAELEKEYAGKAAIVFIDVWENQEPARTFGIRGIPTQIFFTKEGKEVFRHTGFMDKNSIVEKLRQLGVE